MLTLLRLDKLCLQLKGRIIATVKAMLHGQHSIDPLCGGPVVSRTISLNLVTQSLNWRYSILLMVVLST